MAVTKRIYQNGPKISIPGPVKRGQQGKVKGAGMVILLRFRLEN